MTLQMHIIVDVSNAFLSNSVLHRTTVRTGIHSDTNTLFYYIILQLQVVPA
jgi:hypothetical protein